MFQHTAARRRLLREFEKQIYMHQVSTHSRAEAAADRTFRCSPEIAFQHTAARRRLQVELDRPIEFDSVSTHSRAEAAAIR